MAELKYERILLKLGGESMAGPDGYGINPSRASEVAQVVKEVSDLGVQVAIVIGAGNLWRGNVGMEMGMDRTTADHMGMIATVMNSLALRDALEREGIPTRVQTAVEMRTIAEPYIRLRAIRHMEKGRVVIFAAGSGNPYFTTDTAAVLRAKEIHAEILLKATKVNGLYDSDPERNTEARFIKTISYMEVLERQLRVMDMTAISLAMDNHLPLMVFNLKEKGNIQKVVRGEDVGTTIGG